MVLHFVSASEYIYLSFYDSIQYSYASSCSSRKSGCKCDIRDKTMTVTNSLKFSFSFILSKSLLKYLVIVT